MSMINEIPNKVYYVVQMLSRIDGVWVDVVTVGENFVGNALERWRLIHPGREFRPVRRTVIDEVLPG